jgi:asparagine synthase (glutamine-hydrolysing)
MCGIIALVAYGPAEPSIAAALGNGHRALAHRGPDGEAFLWAGPTGPASRSARWPPPGFDPAATPSLAIGFRHLRVNDFHDEALQPFASADGQSWIAFNGEIYNAHELRLSLKARGHAFRTRVDTEVALAAYREWGAGCFARFNGMWAIVIVDLARRVMVGSRDRLGVKPLYYAVDRHRIVLASEPQAVVRARREPPAVDTARVREFLSGVPPQTAGGTFFRGVRAVPAASTFEIDLRARYAGDVMHRRFWDLHDFVASDGSAPRLERAVADVRSHVESSVALQSQAAVPVGCLLSGGLDTSLVARTLANRALAGGSGPVPCYSIVFREPEMSELPFIWSVVRHGGLESHRHELTTRQVWHDVDAVVRAQGQPLLGQDVIAQYRAYQLAREHGSVVVLEGQGADELLAGMPSYADARLRELAAGRRFGPLALELWMQSRRRDDGLTRAVARTMRGIVRALAGAPRAAPWPDWLIEDPSDVPESDGWTPSRDPSLLNQHLFRLVTRTNLPTVLQLQDRSSMAHGVESRVPLLDHRFVEYCFTLPAGYKVHRGRRKHVLAEAARGIVPETVLNRRDKKTFVSRIDWMPLRECHGSELRDMASSERMQHAPWFRDGRVTSFVDGFLRGRHRDGMAVWRLYTAWRWMELFEVRA